MAAHKRMARSERAKQFMPFAALRGYDEALRMAEEEHRIAWEEERSAREDESIHDSIITKYI